MLLSLLALFPFLFLFSHRSSWHRGSQQRSSGASAHRTAPWISRTTSGCLRTPSNLEAPDFIDGIGGDAFNSPLERREAFPHRPLPPGLFPSFGSIHSVNYCIWVSLFLSSFLKIEAFTGSKRNIAACSRFSQALPLFHFFLYFSPFPVSR